MTRCKQINTVPEFGVEHILPSFHKCLFITISVLFPFCAQIQNMKKMHVLIVPKIQNRELAVKFK